MEYIGEVRFRIIRYLFVQDLYRKSKHENNGIKPNRGEKKY